MIVMGVSEFDRVMGDEIFYDQKGIVNLSEWFSCYKGCHKTNCCRGRELVSNLLLLIQVD